MTDRKKQLTARLIPRLQEVQHAAGWISPSALRSVAAELELPIHHVHGVASFYPHFRLKAPPQLSIHVCQDLACHLKHGGKLLDRARAFAEGRDIEVEPCSCLGQCDAAPAAMVGERPVAYGNEKALIDALSLAMAGKPMPLTHQPVMPGPIRTEPYAQPSDRYGALRDVAKDLANARPQVIQKLLDAGLRGMGGAAFPVGLKWKALLSPAAQQAPQRYIICNADESEVGTFKDREILSLLPHLVIEGMAIAALITKSTRGYLYIRHEYVDQIEILQKALAEAKAVGAIGRDVFGSGRAFEITLFVSPGGYIQGEGSALMEAIEGRRGQPRNGTEDFGGGVRSTVSGLFGQPTIINNVESFAFVPSILRNGPQWFQEQGIGGNPGLKWIGVGGDVERPQVMEVGHGATFAYALERCGGMKDGKKLKAIMPSGPSFGFLPPDSLDAGMEFPDKNGFGKLAKAGASIGSAAVLFLNEDRDLVDCALNCTKFYRNESCGKCVPCRVGAQKMVDIISGVLAGSARADDIDQVERLSQTLYLTSICGLGQVVPKPFETVVKYWGDGDDRIRRARGLNKMDGSSNRDAATVPLTIGGHSKRKGI